MSLINISNLTFAYEGSYDNIFENVTFQIDTDWKLGFTGRNGRGKTTFLKLLRGEYEYSGSITSSVNFEYFPFAVTDKTKNTREVIDGIWPNYEFWQLSKELSLLQVAEDVLDRPFNTLSQGEQTKVLLAALFLKENNYLLIDEPTNHLDLKGRTLVSSYLHGKKGFILVSHDRAFLDNCIDHILSINKTNIEIQKGNFSSWYNNKQAQDRFEIAEARKLKKEIRRLSAAARQTASWSDKVEKSKRGRRDSGVKADKGFIGHKAAKMMKRSKVTEARREKAVEEKANLLQNIETADSLKIKPRPYHTDKLVEARDLSLFYEGRPVLSDVSFTVHRGDRVAVIGKNGSGKSSLFKLLLGEEISFSGSLRTGSNLVISYIPQNTSFLQGSLQDYARSNLLDESLFLTILRKLDFPRVQFEKDISAYSEGQKKKVLLAKSLCEQAHLYIWDEPLNYIDILSRIQVEELVLKHEPTLLFVEHDHSFVRSVATKEIVL